MTEPVQDTPEPVQPPRWRQTPLVIVIASQVAGGGVAFGGTLGVAVFFGIPFSLEIALLGHGFLAAIIGRTFGLPGWWFPVNVLMPITAAYATALPIPAETYLIVFLLLLLVYWNAARTRVPLYLSNKTTWQALESLLPEQERASFIDIGSGIGGTSFHLGRSRPDMTFTGVESAPLPYFISRVRLFLSGLKNVQIRNDDFWTSDMGSYDVAYAFLSPAPMTDLFAKLRQEMKPGSLLVSNSFVIPDHPADEVVELNDRRRTKLHVWRMNGQSSNTAASPKNT